MTNWPQTLEPSYLPNALTASQANTLLQQLLHWPSWRQHQVRLFGRYLPQPRLSAFVGEAGLGYRYSGLQLRAEGWPAMLLPVVEAVNHHCQQAFNSCLLNQYRNGRDHMSWHADNEPELGPEPALAILSLSATRRLHLRRNGETRACAHYDLTHNSLLIFPPGLQATHQHRLAPSRTVDEPRISLTFRHICPTSGNKNA